MNFLHYLALTIGGGTGCATTVGVVVAKLRRKRPCFKELPEARQMRLEDEEIERCCRVWVERPGPSDVWQLEQAINKIIGAPYNPGFAPTVSEHKIGSCDCAECGNIAYRMRMKRNAAERREKAIMEKRAKWDAWTQEELERKRLILEDHVMDRHPNVIIPAGPPYPSVRKRGRGGIT